MPDPGRLTGDGRVGEHSSPGLAGAASAETGGHGAIQGEASRSRAADQVAEFHRIYGLPHRSSPTAEIGRDQAMLRQALIDEEVDELREAAADLDIVGIADALADIVYVAYGTAHAYGIDLDAVITEVHRSNMTKLDAAGLPIRRADGKILKGPAYEPPDVAKILAQRAHRPSVTATDGVQTD